MTPLVTLDGLSKRFGTSFVLTDVSLEIRRAEAIGIIGPSGGGKSTLLRCIDLLVTPTAGTITYHWADDAVVRGVRGRLRIDSAGNGEARISAERIRRDMGFVFQGLNLWSDRSVLHNLILAPMIVLGTSQENAVTRATELATQLGIVEKLTARIWEISGGQKQRVALARMLMMRPKLLLLDEVTSALDPLLVVDVMSLIRHLRDEGTTMVIVTHHLEFAASLCDRLVFLNEGRVVQIAPPLELLRRPAGEVVERFISMLHEAR